MSGVSTHILDTSIGRPAAGVSVSLEMLGNIHAYEKWRGMWHPVAEATTDANGRCRLIPKADTIKPGIHRLTFITGPYFAARKVATLYPEVSITFTVAEGEANYHIPLLLNPFGYTTYRGS
jgi:5-hydroxyisourate hydrolase